MFSVRLCFYESLPKIERENRTCQRTNAYQGRRKFRKGSDDDAVGQFVEEAVAFFLTRVDMSQVRYLPNVTPTFPTTGLASVVS